MPRLFRRILLISVLLLGVVTGVAVAFGDRFAGAIARAAVARVTKVAAARGIELRDVRFARAAIAGFGAIRCDDLAGQAVVPRTKTFESRRTALAFDAAQLSVDVGWPWSDSAIVTVVDGNLQALDSAGTPTQDRVDRIQVRVEFPFSWWSPSTALGELEIEARRLGAEGATRLPLELAALARFAVGGKVHDLPLRTERAVDGGARITLERADIERLSQEHTNPLTETEIDLVLRYPQRAPALLRLSEQASRAAGGQRRRDRRFPYDAYRHVYWSWLLTREFGPEFSEEVTDAHEIGATYEFTLASRRMDLHNNAVGRAYALARVPEGELVQRVLTDPNVMRKPVDVSPASP